MPPLNALGKLLIAAGVLCIVAGVWILAGWKIPWFGRLPGDIFFSRGNFKVYVLLTSSIIVSLVLSLILYLLGKWK